MRTDHGVPSLFGHFLDDSSVAFEQTGPYPFVLGTRRHRRILGTRAGEAEQAFHDLLWSTHPRRTGEDRRDRGHALLVGLLTFRQPRRWLRAGRLDHGNTLAIDGGHP